MYEKTAARTLFCYALINVFLNVVGISHSLNILRDLKGALGTDFVATYQAYSTANDIVVLLTILTVVFGGLALVAIAWKRTLIPINWLTFLLIAIATTLTFLVVERLNIHFFTEILGSGSPKLIPNVLVFCSNELARYSTYSLRSLAGLVMFIALAVAVWNVDFSKHRYIDI